jgi:hypothetical protein
VSSSKAADLEIFSFEETFEDFKKNNFFYRTGLLGLSELKQLETLIRSKKIFVAEIV